MVNFQKQTLLVVAPHPDDEVLGCGGLIHRIKEQGGKVYVLYMTVGDTREYSTNGHSTHKERLAEIEAVAKFLDYDDYHIAFPGNKYHLYLDTIAQKDLIAQIEYVSKVSLNTIQPTIIATPQFADYNQDHRSTTQAVLTATRPAPDTVKPLQQIVLGYECVSVADWAIPSQTVNMHLALTPEEIEKKIDALTLYASQIRNSNHSRSLASIKTLAEYRGLYIGKDAAEGFYCYRYIL